MQGDPCLETKWVPDPEAALNVPKYCAAAKL
jgi:hypothetical protein